VQSSHETSGAPKDDEAINSDLDDSDTENEAEAEEGGTGDTDIVFCTYDKVCSSSAFKGGRMKCSFHLRLLVSRISGSAFSRME